MNALFFAAATCGMILLSPGPANTESGGSSSCCTNCSCPCGSDCSGSGCTCSCECCAAKAEQACNSCWAMPACCK